MAQIELNETRINAMASGLTGNSVLRCLAMSWQDAKEYRSVKQNAGQRMSLIENTIHDYLNELNSDKLLET